MKKKMSMVMAAVVIMVSAMSIFMTGCSGSSQTSLLDFEPTAQTEGASVDVKATNVLGQEFSHAIVLQGTTNENELTDDDYTKIEGKFDRKSVTYALDGNYSRFTAAFSMLEDFGEYDYVILCIYADDEIILHQGLNYREKDTTKILTVDKDVSGVKELRIEIMDYGSYISANDGILITNAHLYTEEEKANENATLQSLEKAGYSKDVVPMMTVSELMNSDTSTVWLGTSYYDDSTYDYDQPKNSESKVDYAFVTQNGKGTFYSVDKMLGDFASKTDEELISTYLEEWDRDYYNYFSKHSMQDMVIVGDYRVPEAAELNLSIDYFDDVYGPSAEIITGFSTWYGENPDDFGVSSGYATATFNISAYIDEETFTGSANGVDYVGFRYDTTTYDYNEGEDEAYIYNGLLIRTDSFNGILQTDFPGTPGVTMEE